MLLAVLALALQLGLQGAGVWGMPAEQAPAVWVAYAQQTTQTVTGWLNAADPPAPRVRSFLLAATHPDPGKPALPVVLKLWIAADGSITRMDFPVLTDDEVNRDLQDLVVGRHLPVPPRDMLQPLRIAIQLRAQPAQ